MPNAIIRVVTFQEANIFVAQALEVDVCAQGATAEDARARLDVALRVEGEHARAQGRWLEDIGPAPYLFSVL